MNETLGQNFVLFEGFNLTDYFSGKIGLPVDCGDALSLDEFFNGDIKPCIVYVKNIVNPTLSGYSLVVDSSKEEFLFDIFYSPIESIRYSLFTSNYKSEWVMFRVGILPNSTKIDELPIRKYDTLNSLISSIDTLTDDCLTMIQVLCDVANTRVHKIKKEGSGFFIVKIAMNDTNEREIYLDATLWDSILCSEG